MSSETITTAVLTVTAVDVTSGKLHVDEQITDTSGLIPPDTFIQSFGTGTGGTGTYNLYKASVTGLIETVGTNPGLHVTAVTSGVLYANEQIIGPGIPDGTSIVRRYLDNVMHAGGRGYTDLRKPSQDVVGRQELQRHRNDRRRTDAVRLFPE